jgi:hypothetical protein
MNPELAALQRVINDVHALMQVLRDPAQVNIVSQCLKALTGIQKDMMQPQNGQQAMLQQLGTGGGGPIGLPPGAGGPPGLPPGLPPQLMAALAGAR